MEVERLADDVRQHCHIQLKNKPQINRKLLLYCKYRSKSNKVSKQLSVPLERWRPCIIVALHVPFRVYTVYILVLLHICIFCV